MYSRQHKPAKIFQIQLQQSLAIGGYSNSEYFQYKNFTDARVDVENLRGHNLRS
jgi:hypothetical protein